MAGLAAGSSLAVSVAATAASGEPPEIIMSTTTGVACEPSALTLGGPAAVCTATVVEPSAALPPALGTVEFTSDGAGSLGGGGRCGLAAVSATESSCSVTYAPTLLGSRIHTIGASYPGDEGHAESRGSVAVSVARPAPQTHLKRRATEWGVRRLITFTFFSDQRDAGFECHLDRRPFRGCTSPFRARRKPGRHIFKVRAVNSEGARDPTPATYRWTVGR